MSFNKLKTLFIFSIFFILCCILNLTYGASLDTKLSRNKIILGETVTISFNFNATTNTLPDFSPFEKDFRIVSTNYGTAINMLNGITQAQTFWQVTLEPKVAGELLIPEINFGNVKSTSYKLFVEEAAPKPQQHQQNTPAFVQAELNTLSPYIQSQVLYTFKLFYRSQLENPQIAPPSIKDGTLAQIGDEKSYETTIKGEKFFVFEKHFAIFPQKAGKLIIPPTHFHALQFDANSVWTNDPFSVIAPEPISLTTQSFVLDVQNIPETFQGKIWLPAKNISLTEKWSPASNQWEIGNPITRTITIAAQGLRADQIPDLPIDHLTNINVYADPPQRNNSWQGNSVLGTWQQKITYIPNQVQAFTTPNVKLNWWNTETNKNAIAELKSITVQIQGKTNIGLASTYPLPNATTVKSASNLSHDSEIATMQPLKSIQNQISPFYFSMWFWISVFLLLIWLMTLWWIWKNKASKTSKAMVKEFNSDFTKPVEFNDKDFKHACEQGNCVLAQKFLLLWAKKQWQDSPRNLAKLREIISDEDFKKALENLEKALYAGNDISWTGHDLLSAYQHIRKHKVNNPSTATKAKKVDPLPPLNP